MSEVLNFPSNPVVGDKYRKNDIEYEWNGTKWKGPFEVSAFAPGEIVNYYGDSDSRTIPYWIKPEGQLITVGTYPSLDSDFFVDFQYTRIYPSADSAAGGTSYDLDCSSNGEYCVFGGNTSPYYCLLKRLDSDSYGEINNTFSPNPPGIITGVRFSDSDRYLSLAYASSSYASIYERSGDNFNAIAYTGTAPANYSFSTDFSSDSQYLAYAVYSSSSPLVILKKTAGGYETLATQPNVPSASGLSVEFSHNNEYLAFGFGSPSTAPNLWIYKRSGDTFTKLPDPIEPPPFSVWGLSFSSDDTYLAVSFYKENRSDGAWVYKRSGDTFTKIAELESPSYNTANCYSIKFSPDDQYLYYIINGDNTTILNIFKRTNDTFSPLRSTFDTSFIQNTRTIVIAKNDSDQYLFFGGLDHPYGMIYRKVDDGDVIAIPEVSAMNTDINIKMYTGGSS